MRHRSLSERGQIALAVGNSVGSVVAGVAGQLYLGRVLVGWSLWA